MRSTEVFYSYSHKDEKLRDQLETHLALLKRRGVIANWHDRRIRAGLDWTNDIDEHLHSARIILLLVSATFLASDYCYEVEVKRAIERHERGDAVVIPVILRPCDWTEAPFARMQALPRDAKPVVRWRDRDEAFNDIARGIRDAVNSLWVKELESRVKEMSTQGNSRGRAATTAGSEAAPRSGRKKILVVDDEQEIADTLALILRQSGYDPIVAYDGLTGVETAKRERPWLVFTDVIMPVMDGIEETILVQKLLPNCHVWLFSGNAKAAALRKGARALGNDIGKVMVKPVHPEEILRLLAALERRESRETLRLQKLSVKSGKRQRARAAATGTARE